MTQMIRIERNNKCLNFYIIFLFPLNLFLCNWLQGGVVEVNKEEDTFHYKFPSRSSVGSTGPSQGPAGAQTVSNFLSQADWEPGHCLGLAHLPSHTALQSS